MTQVNVRIDLPTEISSLLVYAQTAMRMEQEFLYPKKEEKEEKDQKEEEEKEKIEKVFLRN